MNDDYQLHRALMLIESKYWRFEANKLTAIKDELGLSPTRYYLLVNGIVVDPSPEIAGEFAATIKRLRRRIDAKLRIVHGRVA